MDTTLYNLLSTKIDSIHIAGDSITMPVQVTNYIQKGNDSLLRLPFWFWQLIVFPILIGVLMFFISRSANKIKEEGRILSLWSFIQLWVVKTVEHLEGHIKPMKDFLDLPLITSEGLHYIEITESDEKRILDISYSDLTFIFLLDRITGKKAPFLNAVNFYALISVLKSISLHFDRFEKYMEEYYLKRKNNIAAIDKTNKLIFELEEKYEQETKSNTVENEYVKLMLSQKENLSSNSNLSNEELIGNCQQKLNCLIKMGYTDINIQLRNHLVDLKIELENSKIIRENANDSIKFQIQAVDTIIKELNNLMDYFETIPFKHWIYFPG